MHITASSGLAQKALRALALRPLAMSALPSSRWPSRPVASTGQSLWLSAALCAALVPATSRSTTGARVLAILAASVLCALALVNAEV